MKRGGIHGLGDDHHSAYICVTDMARAIKFYEAFFEQPVDVRDDVLSVFDYKGFRLCLFNYRRVSEDVIWGTIVS